MSAPVIVQIRPLTIAEMAPGETYEPGYVVFCIETLRSFGLSGRDGFGFQCQVWLPPQHREPTEFNARLAMELLRRSNPDACAMIDKIAALSRDPRSRKEAERIGMTEGFVSPDSSAAFMGRANTPPVRTAAP
ncbi:MAG: hypothetical protein E5Y65_08780 [Mesorhizobium sp.]|uniref:hypothetical protein n=1 Tax=Mesorhizobium sp. TaxID=1871066 RepID=UPI0011FAE034|nr:hypothetical protein [Mesorhizobium sp.]TIL91720.1 MAG: hypothetical protein E5Y65_08780 [Mesorhizobium sp.]TIM00641.1 MAG: hypothetical protein E5Y64_14075 [Mesorhizobium sp.]